jgi:predicted nucleic acid-binding protein
VRRLDDALAGVDTLGFDTPPVIYFVEAHPIYYPLYYPRVQAVFRRVASGTITGITSVITLAEVLIQPLRHGNSHLQQEYRDLLLNSASFEILPADAESAESAARLRAHYQLRLSDALQVATALSGGCQAFLTNDRTLQRVTELSILILDDLEL